jgi:hypothetical protein
VTVSSNINAKAVYADLCMLVGDWHGVNEEGHDARVRYYLTANSTALVEHWYFHNHMESLTIYHPDDQLMMATHYCPVGNQPRLDLVRIAEDGSMYFEYRSATNLPDFEVDHQHAFDLKIIDADTFHRNETYLCAGVSDSNGITFKRVK